MANVSQAKRCSKCGETKVTTEFYIKRKESGKLFSWCKVCHAAMMKARYEADPEASRKRGREAQARRRAKDSEAVNAKGRQWYAAHREQMRKAHREKYGPRYAKKRAIRRAAYRKAHAEELRAKAKEWFRTNKEEINARQREKYKKNREKILEANRTKYGPKYAEKLRVYRQKNKAKRAVYNAAWRKKNPEKAKDSVIRRRCRILNAEGTHTAAQWKALKAKYGNRCLCCGRPESAARLHRDHVIPLCKGGSNWITNLQPLCRHCNSQKGKKIIDYRPAATEERTMLSTDELKKLRETHEGCVLILDDGQQCYAEGDDCAAVKKTCELRKVPCLNLAAAKGDEGKEGDERDVVLFNRDALAVVITGLTEDGHKVAQCGMAKQLEPKGGAKMNVPPDSSQPTTGAKPQPPADAAPVPATESKPESTAGARPEMAPGSAPVTPPGAGPVTPPGAKNESTGGAEPKPTAGDKK